MENINIFIKENVGELGYMHNEVHIAPEIPEKILNNAISSFECEDNYNSILAVFDSTKFKSGKEGLIFTGKRMLYSANNKVVSFDYDKIESVKYASELKKGIFGKEDLYQYLIINMDKGEFIIDNLSGLLPIQNFSFEKLEKLLNTVITDFQDYEEEDQLKTLSEMPNELKMAYLKVIINMTFEDDEMIDNKELAELFLLMTRFDLEIDVRFEIRKYITEISKDNIESLESLVEIIQNYSEASHLKSLMISLCKDMINVYFTTKETKNRSFKFLEDNKKIFNLSEDEINLAYDTVENDYKLIEEDLDDDAIKKNAEELGAKAVAAGAPLAAVYISGSVVGMSAAGITSGLATLGMGMGMSGGLAIIGVIGVLSYKGVKHLTGSNELDKYKTRELMLRDIVKQNQKTVSLIIDDLNYLVDKLNSVTEKQDIQNKEIQLLKRMIAKFTAAAKTVSEKSNNCQNIANKLQCPKNLDIERLKSLTSDATKKPLYTFITCNYEEDNYGLNNNVQTETLEKMIEIFKVLGYFDIDNILKGKASEGFNKVKNIFG